MTLRLLDKEETIQISDKEIKTGLQKRYKKYRFKGKISDTSKQSKGYL